MKIVCSVVSILSFGCSSSSMIPNQEDSATELTCSQRADVFFINFREWASDRNKYLVKIGMVASGSDDYYDLLIYEYSLNQRGALLRNEAQTMVKECKLKDRMLLVDQIGDLKLRGSAIDSIVGILSQ